MLPNNHQPNVVAALFSVLFVLLSGCASTSPPAVEPIIQASEEPDIPGQEDLGACPVEAKNLTQTMLTLLNQTRSQSRMCGPQSWDAAPPLASNEKLDLAAARHSADMATHNFFSHEGSNGLKADSRTNETGYQWLSVAENIAGGQTDMVNVIEDWLESDKHCENLMRPELSEAGVGCFKNEDTMLKIYWTLVLARPLLE